MKGVTVGVGLFVVSLLLGRPLPVQAQASTLKLADFVGTWEEVPLQTTGHLRIWEWDAPPLYHSLTFQPDSTVIMTIVFLHSYEDGRADTTSMSRKLKFSLVGDTVTMTSAGGYYGWSVYILRLQDGQLVQRYCGYPQQREAWGGCAATWIYKRVDPSQNPLHHMTGAGFGSRLPIPAHPRTPTGTLEDLLGAWEKISTPQLEKTFAEMHTDGKERFVREIRVFRPDSTVIGAEIRENGKDTLAKGFISSSGRMGWGGWKRLPGDSIITIPGFGKGWKIVLQKEQLSYYYNGELLEAFKPIELSKRP